MSIVSADSNRLAGHVHHVRTMDSLTVAAAAGLQARMEALDMLANNISNSSTAGFKRDGEFYNLFADAEAFAANAGELGTLPVIEKHWTDFSQGTLQNTGSPLDFALSGPGFFSVIGPSGPLYTRNGSFQIDASGRLVTSEGYPVRTVGGGPLQVQGGFPIEMAPDGTVRQNGADIGRLAIVDFTADAIAKQGSTMFVAAPGSAPAASAAQVHQGKLEAANVGTAESAVRLVSLLRHFEMLQKAIGIGAEMNRKAIDEVARVGS